MLLGAFQVVTMTALLSLQSFGCGVEWKVPKDHFDGVNEYGYVSYWDKVGDLDLEEGLAIPLVIGFQSDREWSSPYLGYGWIMPLFDSNIVQTGENSFEQIAPDGYTLQFGRDGKNPALLSGVKGWKGEIAKDTITLWASCGWKLVYTKGKITSIGTPKGKTLNIFRDAGGVATEAVYNGKVVLRVDRDFKGVVTGLSLGDKRIGLEQTEKPRIQSIHGKNVVAGKDMSLGKVSCSTNVIKSYEYAVTEGLQPKVTVTDPEKPPRQIAWDPVSRFIISDGGWSYDINPSQKKGFNASIEREDRNTKKKELWFYDLTEGREIVKSADGISRVTKWFTSGMLAGKIRSITRTDNKGNQILEYKVSYDENGVKLAEHLESAILMYSKNGVTGIEYSDGEKIVFDSK